MVTWVLLAGAIVSEVTATVSLRLSEGLRRLTPSIVVVIGYLVSFVLLAQVLNRGVSVAVAYGIWSAVGVSLVALIGVVFLHESLSWVQLVGLGLVILGVAAVQSGANPH